MNFQPKNKSFAYYVSVGFEYASGRELNEKELVLLKRVSKIDAAVIRIDDILDEEQERNGITCSYITHGIGETIIQARLDEIDSTQALTELMVLENLSSSFRYEILKIFNYSFMYGVYEGQRIDKELEREDEITESTINKYFSMVRNFTGGHIRYGLEIGQLLAGKMPDENVSYIGELLGTNRQIIDDFEDYFKEHHLPFGDIKRGNKRLPEILFVLNGGKRSIVLNEIQKGNTRRVVEMILNEGVRNELYTYCRDNLLKCEQVETDFDYTKISIDPNIILTRKI